MIASKEFNKRRATFMKLAAADDLPPALVKLAYLIAYKEIDLKTQTTRRYHAALAARMGGVNTRTVQRLLGLLTKHCGLVVQSGRGRRQMDTFWIGPPPENATCKSHYPTRKCDMENATPMSHSSNEGSEVEAKASTLAGRESEPLVRDPGSARTALEGAAAEPSRPERYVEAEPGGTSPKGWRRVDEPAHSEHCSESPPAEDGGVHAAWRALRELWSVRPWPMTPREMAIARAIFVRLIAEGVAIDDILAGGGAWVRGIDDPRFLMALPQWLQAHGWERKPPAKRARRASRWQRPRSVAEAMADLAREAAS